MSEFVDGIKTRFWNMSHPLLVLVVIGVLVRFLIMPFAYIYDSDYWALVVRNIDVGAGLYEMYGYFYTPVWGYVLGLMNAIDNMFLDLGFYAVVIPDAMILEGSGHQLTATVTSPAFNYFTKIPLVFVDTLTAYFTYLLVMEHTGDRKRSIIAFGLAYLCPVVLGSAGIIGMPDSISAMFMMLTLLLVFKERMFLAGMCFSMSILTKFFPIFMGLALLVYIFKKYTEKGEAFKQMLMAFAGVLITAILIFLPQIIDGNLMECFHFLTDRVDGAGGPTSPLDTFINNSRVICYIFIAIAILFVTRQHIRSTETDLEKDLMKYALITITLSLMYPPTTQYIVTLVPLLAYYVTAIDHRFMLCWKVLAVGSAITVLVTTTTMVLPVAEWWGLMDVNGLLELFKAENTGANGITFWNIHYVVGGALQYLGVGLIFVMMYLPLIRTLRERKARTGKTD
ncbi:MAG: glycosyltransferase 87 family protein [archaeon]|nr:glycosyltransferase 87 family protein [archaeon]